MTKDEKKDPQYFFNALQHAHVCRKTGVLYATYKTETLKVFIREGNIIDATGFLKKVLVEFLSQNKGIITAKQLAQCLEQSKQMRQSLWKILVFHKYITLETLSANIRKQTVLTFTALLIWPDIKFQFKEVPLDEGDILPVRVHIIESIYDATHRIEEMPVIKKYLHSRALVFERGSLIDPKEISLTSGEAAVFYLVNGGRRISQIIEDSAISENDVYRYMMTLFSIGLVDLAGQEESKTISKTNDAANSVGNLKEKILSNMRELPPMLKIALKAREIIANPSFNFKEISTVIEKDQGMASQILKTANSAYYGLTGQVSSVKHASVVLGYKILEEIIISTSAKGHFDKPLEGYQLNHEESWQHSLTVAFAAKALATETKPALGNDAFTIGLFHDIGKIALNPYILQHQTSFQEALEKEGTTVADVERQLFGFDHAQLGSELCIRWNFPKTITDAIKNHHSPPQSDDDELTYILYIVNILNKKDLSGSADQILDGIDPGATAKLNIEVDMLKKINEKAFEAFGKIAGET